jgi:hypothetical protein
MCIIATRNKIIPKRVRTKDNAPQIFLYPLSLSLIRPLGMMYKEARTLSEDNKNHASR